MYDLRMLRESHRDRRLRVRPQPGGRCAAAHRVQGAARRPARRLESAGEPLVLVVAPPGFVKDQAARAMGHDDRSVGAWLSCGETDTEPAQFWSRLTSSLAGQRSSSVSPREPPLGVQEDPRGATQARPPGRRIHDPPGPQSAQDPAGAEAAHQHDMAAVPTYPGVDDACGRGRAALLFSPAAFAELTSYPPSQRPLARSARGHVRCTRPLIAR